MKPPSILAALAPLLALVACNSASSPPPVSATQTTSATFDTGVPPESQNRFAERYQLMYVPAPRHTVAAMDQWGKRYPGAASLLASWIQDHPQTAVKLASWENKNPERLRVLVDWASTRETESLGGFFFGRAGWGDLQQIVDDDPAGVQEFLTWIRSAPVAARELAMHPEGLAYADQHWGAYAHVDTSGLASAQRARAKPARGPALSIENAGKAQVGMRSTDASANAPPPAKPKEPDPSTEQPVMTTPLPYPFINK